MAAPSPLFLFLFKFELVSIGVSSAGWLACFDIFFGLLDVGVAGDAGDAGVAGVVGITGDTGVAGDAGVTRVAGVVGTTGVTGVAGDAGVAGTADVLWLTFEMVELLFVSEEGGYYLFRLVSGTPSSSGSPWSSPPGCLLWAGPDPGSESPPACCCCWWWWLLWFLWLLLYFRCFQYSGGKTCDLKTRLLTAVDVIATVS